MIPDAAKAAAKRVEVIGDATLLLGDCVEILPHLGPVDAVVTSPPYNLGNTSGGGFPNKKLGHYPIGASLNRRGGQGKWARASKAGGLAHGYGTYDDGMKHEAYVEWQKNILRACWSLLSRNGAIFYNHKPRIFDGHLITPLDYNPALPVRQVVIWARAGGINFSSAFYCPTHEWICIFSKHDFRLRDKAASGVGDVWYIPQEASGHHPAPFPLRVPATILETITANTILDPFCGSGTTGVACAKLGRKFVGIEIEPAYFDIACRRIEAAYKQPDLFIDRPAPAVQEPLFGKEPAE